MRFFLARFSSLHFPISEFCTAAHSFPQLKLEISLAKKKDQVYRLGQIEPGGLKNLTAQLKEGATAERRLRPQSFLLHEGLLARRFVFVPPAARHPLAERVHARANYMVSTARKRALPSATR